MDKIFNKPFAVNGARVAIPENGTENERVSFDKGFTQPYEVEAPSVDNPNGQGFNILRPEMNEIFNQLSNACNVLAENIDKWTRLITENLNDIKQAGRYFQNLSINATNERNYPVNNAGYLIVLNNSINSYGVTQIYKQWDNERVFIRRTTSTTDWSAWDSFVLTSEFNNKIISLQNTDTNLNNNKEDKTKFTNGIINATTNSNLDNLTQNGFYWRTANTGSPLPITNGGAIIVNTNGSQVIQYFLTDIWNSGNGGIWFRTRNGSNVWTEWHHLENSEHAEATYRKIVDSYTKSETNNLLNQKEDKTKFTNGIINATTNSNLDNLTQNGFYWRTYNTAAPLPTNNGGAIIVNTNGSQVIQYFLTDYIDLASGGAWVRTRNASNVWSEWRHLENSEHAEATYRKIADSYSRSEINNLLNQKSGLGVGQTWQILTNQRAKNQTYTNDTGKPIMVAIDTPFYSEGIIGHIRVNGINVLKLTNNTNSGSIIVPNGSSYGFFTNSLLSIEKWAELR